MAKLTNNYTIRFSDEQINSLNKLKRLRCKYKSVHPDCNFRENKNKILEDFIAITK